MMLIELSRENYKDLTGIDYSASAIELSKQIAIDQSIDIAYHVLDLLNENDIKQQLGEKKFDIVHDKGTYDAISLNPQNPSAKRNAYIENVYNITAENGLFILSSCNWTEDELCTSLNGKFVKYKNIPTPTFKFGGKIGTVVTQVVFQKV